MFTLNRKTIALFITAVMLITPLLSAPAHAQKVAYSVNPITLNEGSSRTVQIHLDAPIICPSGAPTCQVDLNFSSSNPSQISFSQNTVTWLSFEWAQTRTVTINTIDDGIYTNTLHETVTGTAVSNSIYYNGFIAAIPLTINNIDPAPPTPGVADQTVNLLQNSSKDIDVITGVSGSPDPASLTITSGPAHGSTSIAAGVITYTPNANYVGTDSLTYSVCSTATPLICGTATISFAVSAPTPGITTSAPIKVVIDPPNTGFGAPSYTSMWFDTLRICSVVFGVAGIGLLVKRKRFIL